MQEEPRIGAADFYEAFCACLCHAYVLQCKRICLYLAGPPQNKHPSPICQLFSFCLSLQRSWPEPDHQVAAEIIGLSGHKIYDDDLACILPLTQSCTQKEAAF